MDTPKSQSRLLALDGIRGIAIILVVLTHVSSKTIQAILPPFIARILFSSGVTGVSLLFILSGFFMALMYPAPQDRLAFIQKRYTRIFPLFLVMCALTVLVRIEAYLWYQEIAVFFLLSLTAHGLWVLLAKRHLSQLSKRLVFLGFLGLQASVGFVYFFWLMRQPIQVFMDVWSLRSREVMTGLINATLTLPLGNYIPMIDGVYWSLAAEVLFYILYVIVCVPLIARLRSKSRTQKILILALCLPFFGALQLFSDRFLNLSLLRPLYGVYFAMGISLGYLYRHHQDWFESVSGRLSGWLAWVPVIFFFFCVGFKDQSFQYVPDWFDPWLHMLWSIPLTLAIALALDARSMLARILHARVLVFFGMISYSVYLCHSLTLHLIEHLIPIHSVATNLLNIGLTLIVSTFAARWLYEFLEKPYFDRQNTHVSTDLPRQSKFFRSPMLILTSLGIMLTLSIITTYQSRFSFFSVRTPLKLERTANPDHFVFTTPTSSLGILTLRFTHERFDAPPGPSQRLRFAIKVFGSDEWHAVNTYALQELGDGVDVPFGFPTIDQASGKKFEIELTTLVPESAEYIILDPQSLQVITPIEKQALLRQPQKLAIFILGKILVAISDQEAQFVLLATIPTLAIIGFFTRRYDND